MALDTRLPILAAQGAQVNLVDMYRQAQDMRAREQQMQMQREGMELEREQMDWRRELQTLQMDEKKAEALKAGLKDMSAAVQWADTPDKWAIVQQHYAQYDPQLASIGFEQREQSLIQLGQMSEYLEKTSPKIMSIEAGGSLAAVDPRTGKPNFTVLPNPGGAQPGAPVGGEERKTVGGRSFVKRGGQWFEETGGSNAAGGFPPGQ